MRTSAEMPLIGAPPKEIPLTEAPLVRVIAQVRFPLIASIETREFIGPFQESIRQEYAVLRPEQTREVLIGTQGVQDTRMSTVWRFNDTNDTTLSWRVSLASGFLALETAHYSSRDDFFDRFNRLLTALQNQINPQFIDRLGVRYINRIMGNDLVALPTLVRPEIAGIMATPLCSHASQAISETLFDLPDEGAQLMARWGLIPGHATVDPAAVEILRDPSWLLDLDAFQLDTRAFDVDAVVAHARSLSERIYSFFRWCVTDDFLRPRQCGAQP